MNEEDIRKQLELKNKEIYLNKLSLDLANNLEVLALSIENLLTNISEYSVKRIISIAESFGKEEIIKETMNTFIDNYRTFLMTLFEDKKTNLEQLFTENEDLNRYKNYLKQTNTNIKEQLNAYYEEHINNVINKITNLYDNSFCNLRIDEYLKNILRENLINKLMDTINSRDIILLNTFKESFLKYQELNKNTIGTK